jgi:hydrogenase expression/formation protein HypE
MDRKEETARFEGATCPVPYSHTDTIVMGHGSGGRLSQDLIAHMFLPPFDNPALRAGDDAGVVRPGKAERLAISTDSHVVWPLFFPGGDIGRLAVCGTVNDVAMMGATPLYLTTGFILEEGVQIALIERVVASMKAAATEAGVQIVAGDTKVVQRGKADGLYITTTGVGLLENSATIGGAFARPGDLVILSGPIGDHGIAVLSARGDLGFEAEVESDIAPLNHLIATMLEAGKISHS